MTERIRLVLETYREDPLGARQHLRVLINEDQRGFVTAAAQLLSQEDKTAFQPVIETLARGAGVIQQLCDPELLDKDSSIELAQRIAAIEPRLDTKLVSLLPGRGSVTCDGANAVVAERALEILDAISASMRLVPMLAHLIGHPNPRLRAKISKLVGRTIRNARALEERLNEVDPRVRANAVESLWGEKAPWAPTLLWKATHDVNNRVAGNALFGLYDLQDEKVIPHIVSMAEHPKPLFRSTAAWTMGRTGDKQFLPALEKLTRDLYALVRKNARKAIEQINKPEAVPDSLEATSQNR
jgi:hypothetical protein